MQDQMTIAVVEDNDWYRRLLVHTLEMNPDHRVEPFGSGKALLDDFNQSIQVVTVDYRLPDMTGAELLMELRKRNPNVFVIIVSEQEDIETAVDLLKGGAHDYIVKSEHLKSRIHQSLEIIKKQLALQDQIETLQGEVRQKFDYQSLLVGESDAIKSTHVLIQKAIKTNINVVITGETGTGKELVAKTIHYNSGYSKGPFVAVNIAAIPSELIESELFGHVKGAFTGAQKDRVGKFEQAANGTLLLDEIGEMELALQAKLLRVLQEREFTKVGSNQVQQMRCRILVATNRSLVELVKRGKFREDLYYRLYGITITLPPLRERGNDILILANKFIQDYCQAQELSVSKLEKSAVKKLLAYRFPGNVRELKAVAELAVTMAEGALIAESDIVFPEVPLNEQLLNRERTMREYEYFILRHFLNKYGEDVQLVADKLAIGKSTIYRMLKEMEDSQDES